MSDKHFKTPRPKYWFNLEQWSKDSVFNKTAKSEFVSPPLSEKEIDGLWDRREFLKLMGASMALASVGCIRRPAEKIVPYIKRPKDVTIGKANFYSSSYYDGEEGFGIVVKTRSGRPIKIEGNSDHPVNKGALSARAHSHLLSLYDPERLQHPQHNLFNKQKTNSESINTEYPVADKDIVGYLQKKRVAFLTGEWPSPASFKLLKDFCHTFKAKHFVWNPLNHVALQKAQKICYGKAITPRFMLNRARLVVSINCDFLGTWLYPTEMTRMYAKARTASADMNRLIVFESLLSLTGSNADYRVRILPSQNLYVVLALVHSLIQKGFVKEKWPSHLPAIHTPWKVIETTKQKWDQLVENLWQWRGQSLILSGGLSTQTHQSESLQIATLWLNHLLNNDGWTVNYKQHYRNATWESDNNNFGSRNIEELITQLENGKIDTLIIHKTNPLYTYPNSERLQKAFKKVKCIVYTGDRKDETGRFANYILPDHHELEKWSDWEFQKGVLSVQQPTIRPLYHTRAFEDSLIAWAKLSGKKSFLKGSTSWYHYLRKTLSLTDDKWHQLLQTGVVANQPIDKRLRERKFNHQALKHIQGDISNTGLAKDTYQLVLYATGGLKDGTLANVSWLQEFPDPITKICWDNYFCISPNTAKQRGIKEGQIIKVTRHVEQAQDITVKGPVHIQPGQADRVVALALGYGRQGAGRVADRVGVSGYPLAQVSSQTGQVAFSALSVSVRPSNQSVSLANVQGHHSMEGRQIVVEATLKNYLQNPGGAIHRHKLFSLWSDHAYPKHKWGMVIDLNSCTGCSACVTACQSENNIPVVGKDLVLQGREMHWIRVDRYYKGTPQNPSVVHQPIVCMHCDNAPCETVCPVAATVHSDEGTNDMIYNRCVGTRYCSNNCPYKVRRFNWFNYAKLKTKTPKEALNPEVTVRSRGVMEKCTFCIHRIRSAQAQAKLENRELKDGDIQTACQQSCPAGAIVFGDLKDPASKVHKMFSRPDAYSLLEELNTKPAVRYRVKVRNKEETSSDNSHKEHHHG